MKEKIRVVMCLNKRERQTDIMINKTGSQPVSRPEKQTLLGLKTTEGKKEPVFF